MISVRRDGRRVIAQHDETGTCFLVVVTPREVPDAAPTAHKIRAIARADREASEQLAALLRYTALTRARIAAIVMPP